MSDETKPQPNLPHADMVGVVPSSSDSGTVPQASEAFGNAPNPAEAFRSVPEVVEQFRTVPLPAAPVPPTDWRESYTLTVRETARLFESAGVARSERSIVNWCQQNRQGLARLDAYFDPNERRYFITRQSVDSIIAEEKARAAKAPAAPMPQVAEEFGTEATPDAEGVRKIPSPTEDTQTETKTDSDELAELRKENLDLKITNRGKDYFIEQLQKEREGLLRQVVDSSHQIGRLETRLLQLDAAPREHDSDQNERTA